MTRASLLCLAPVIIAVLANCDEQVAQRESGTDWNARAEKAFEQFESVVMKLKPLDADTGEPIENMKASYITAGLKNSAVTMQEIMIVRDEVVVFWVAPKMAIGRVLIEANGYDPLYVDPLDEEIRSYEDPSSVDHKSQTTESRVVEMRRKASGEDSPQVQP